MKEKFSVTGMTCSACSSGIERALNRLDGVKKAEVSLMSESMVVDYDESLLSRENIINEVVGLGYGATLFNENSVLENKPQPNKLKKQFFISLVLLLPLTYLCMGHFIPWIKEHALPPHSVSFIAQALLALVIIILNFRFYTSGIRAIIKKVPTMDTLVALGSAVSYIYSLVLTIIYFCTKSKTAPHLFFESSAMILVFVTLGKWLEEKSKRKTGEEIEKLIRLMPNTVTVEYNGVQSKKAFSDLVQGDILVVKQGEYIPVDGKVIEGSAHIDRSALTGESMPIEVKEGDKVTGADIVKGGFIKVLAEKVGADTALSQIVKMVKEAGASKAPLQKVADKVASVFVPTVCLIAVFVFGIWLFVTKGDIGRASNYAICVLVISCPCSLGLATPVAVMASTGRGMSLGILYKDAEALQKAKDINCVLLDKTATLTVGKPKVTDFLCYGKEETEILRISQAIESRSNHPIAECILAFTKEKIGENGAEISDYQYETGKGATGVYNGKTYRLGNRRLLGKKFEKQANKTEKEYSEQGKTAVFLADEKEILGVFAIADTLKEESKEAIAKLKAKNIRVGMLTGDNESVAKAIANEVGIDDYFAEALPEDKAKSVQRIRSVGGFVAMVGDGINDSPALKEADIGIAMGNGTDIAMDSADIILSRGDLNLLETTIDLSRKTVKNIKQNLFWAFFYNCIAIPLAGGAFAFAHISFQPWVGSICMCLSSLFVVTNALRLTAYGKKKDENNKTQEVSMKKTLKVEGMMCQHCVAHVTKALQGVEGVLSVEVNLKKKMAVVEMETPILDEFLTNAVVGAGYEVKKIS